MDAKPFKPGQIEKAAEINGSGKLVKKPVEFCSKSDIREEYRPMMYLPVYTEMNDYVYVSGYEKQRKDLKQIYRVRNINHETWGIPETLNEVINTPYDDEYPYFDARIPYFISVQKDIPVWGDMTFLNRFMTGIQNHGLSLKTLDFRSIHPMMTTFILPMNFPDRLICFKPETGPDRQHPV